MFAAHEFGHPTSDFRLQTSDFRLQASDIRLRVPSCSRSDLILAFSRLSPSVLPGSPMKGGKNREKCGTSLGRGREKVGKRRGEIVDELTS